MRARPPCRGLGVTDASGQMLTLTNAGTLVLFMDESRFSLYRPDGKQGVWHHVGERFADCWSSGQGWWFGYGIGRRMTMNTDAFRMHSNGVTRS